jgi:TonB-linked SusC/RagA family outer membrane protein
MTHRWVVLLGLALLPANAAAQATGTVAGTVTDRAGAPVPGAAVAVAGTARGEVTGADGRFSIEGVPAGTRTLRATKIGFTESTRSVTVAAGQTVAANITLSTAAVAVEGVVAVGYGTVRRQDVTGAVSSVQTEEIKAIPTPSVGESMKGRVPGMVITTNGYTPGSDPTIRIRGVRSLVASNDPLVVVDGVPIAGGLGDVNPGSIQSVEVLKDASATAVYGSRGANGVVLITTNKGRAGVTRVTYETRYGTQQIHNLVKPFTGPEYAQFKREAFRTAGKYTCPGGALACDAADAAIFSPLEIENMRNGVWTDYVDLIARDGTMMDHQLGITGGAGNTRFSVGANFLNEQGVTIAQDFTRRAATVGIDHSDGRFKTGFSANISNQLRNLGRGDGLWGGAHNINPLADYKDAEGNILATPIPDGQSWNPLLDAANWDDEELRTRAFGNAFVGYDLADGVTLQTTFGADMFFVRDATFRGTNTQPNRNSGFNDASVERRQTFNYVSTTQLTADRQLSDAHRINATVLYEIQRDRADRSAANVANLPYEYQKWYNIGTAGTVQSVSSNFSEWGLQSFMGRLNYTLVDRYYLTLTGRQDCSSRLAPGNKCTFFPSAALKWRVSDEGFMTNQGLISDLSLRASYGRTGNTSINPYQTQGALARTTYSFGGVGAFGFRPDVLSNPNLEWEKTETYDVGVEFGLFDNRITGSVDGYLANTFDLLMRRQLPTTSGFGEVLENVGETKNTGLEIALSTVNIDGWKGLTWTSDINFSTNKNEIVSLYGGTEDDVGSSWFIGQPINVYYELEFDGIWQADEAAEAAKYGRTPGMIKTVDQNNDGKINSDDRVIVGRHRNFPKWSGGFSNRFEFGAFDLSSLIVARWGYTVDLGFLPGAMAGRYNQVDVNYWTPENPSNEFPRPNSDQESALDNAALQLIDGSHWRVRNITLGFDVPSALTSRIGDNTGLRIYAQAQDPFIFTAKKDFPGFDPEDDGTLGVPSYRTLLLGASVNF